MPHHVDILDQEEPLKRSFVGSLVFHGLLVASVSGVAFVQQHDNGPMLGVSSPHAGSVAITPFSTPPLPNNNAPPNRVANEQNSKVRIPKAETRRPATRPK